MLRVRDIMTDRVFCLATETPADEARWALTRRHIGGAPVRNQAGKLVGMVSKTDLIDPDAAQWFKNEETVAQVMSPDVRSVQADDPAIAAVIEMARRCLHRVIVLEADGSPVGIVTALDVVQALARGASFACEASSSGATQPAAETI